MASDNKETLREACERLIREWGAAETRMRGLHAGLPGSGYDKLADGYGTCADELSAVLGAATGKEERP